jgi:hypothetical protein
MERPYRMTFSRYSRHESKYQAYGGQIMERQEKICPLSPSSFPAFTTTAGSIQKENSIICYYE